MSIDNPYAPPNAEAGFGKIEADPNSYWIKNETLYVREQGVLPDVCLVTGAVDGLLVRQQQLFTKLPTWVRFAIPIVFVVSFILRQSSAFIITIIAIYAAVSLLTKKLTLNYCLSKRVQTLRNRASYIHLTVTLICLGIFFLTLENYPGFALPVVLVPTFASIFITRRMAPQLSPQVIHQKVAQFKKIHPEALRQLARWREAKRADPSTEL